MEVSCRYERAESSHMKGIIGTGGKGRLLEFGDGGVNQEEGYEAEGVLLIREWRSGSSAGLKFGRQFHL